MVCRGARSRASGYPGQPALLVSGGEAVGWPVYDGRVETQQLGWDISSGVAVRREPAGKKQRYSPQKKPRSSLIKS